MKFLPLLALLISPFVSARDQGLLWDQTAPFPMQLLLDDKRMVQVINGQPPQIITAENNPQMFQFNHLLRALFQADRKVLEQNFRVEFADKGEGCWRLRLTPTTTPLDKIFNTIDLAGQTYLESIQLNDKQGDRTDIALTQHQLTPAQLTDDERQRFAAQ
ncbi:TPA: outer membrane lipoprotein carrier protein LolA [Escherichia coli]|nr:outer membrane lipoprotein carrier protein LolA [Escherichia coli]HDW8584356.1 outer membrane lipoprotein carrier protein LolA [Escherichia coli]HDW8589128.1 outer membrane lipoprotein carrier protein LolA [Escherichia coli]